MVASDGPALTAAEFIGVVHDDVYLAAIRNVQRSLANPPGRQPAARLVAMSNWYTSLSEADHDMVREVVAYAADHALFGLLCLLDNVQPVVDGYREQLELQVRAGAHRRNLTLEGEELHGLFRNRVDEAAGWDT
jgi:hypothetical protein